MTTLELTIPGNLWMSLNDRPHWADKAKRTRGLRALGFAEAIRHKIGPHGPCHVAAFIGYPTNTRADPSNAAWTVKALIDGLVDAGVWPDDDHTYVIGPTYLRGEKTGRPGIHTIRFELTEQTIPWERPA